MIRRSCVLALLGFLGGACAGSEAGRGSGTGGASATGGTNSAGGGAGGSSGTGVGGVAGASGTGGKGVGGATAGASGTGGVGGGGTGGKGIGGGSSGTGGWIRLKGWHRVLAGFMLRQLGLHPQILEGDLDGFYAERLLEFVRSSSFDSVVLLAHERVHDPDQRDQHCQREQRVDRTVGDAVLREQYRDREVHGQVLGSSREFLVSFRGAQATRNLHDVAL